MEDISLGQPVASAGEQHIQRESSGMHDVFMHALTKTQEALQQLGEREGGIGLSFQSELDGEEASFAGHESIAATGVFVDVLTHGVSSGEHDGSAGIYVVAIHDMSDKAPLAVTINRKNARYEIQAIQLQEGLSFSDLVARYQSEQQAEQRTYGQVSQQAGEQIKIKDEEVARTEYVEIDASTGYVNEALTTDTHFAFMPDAGQAKPDALREKVIHTLAPMTEKIGSAISAAQLHNSIYYFTPAHFSL